MEYVTSVWHCSNTDGWKKLEAVQRRVLAVAINAPQTSSREAMKVATSVPPIDLRCSEIAVRDLAKMLAKPFIHPL